MSLLQLSRGPLSVITSSLNIKEHTNLALINKQLKTSINSTYLKKIAKEHYLCKCCGYIDVNAHTEFNVLNIKTILCRFCAVYHGLYGLYWDTDALKRIKDFDNCNKSMIQTPAKMTEHSITLLPQT